jgi:8-oxo-dGTP diphosphatase
VTETVSSRARTSVAAIDWDAWTPDDVATLLFIVDGDRVLLIRKKRGLGAGKINAPGGRLEPGETPLLAAIREVEEEVGVTPSAITEHGSVSFEFTNGYKLRAHLFVASTFRGTPVETNEAIPLWFDRDQLPFVEMWADDALWAPHVLAGGSVLGRFIFEDDTMLDHTLTLFEGSVPHPR